MNCCWVWSCLSCLAKRHEEDRSLSCQFSFFYTLLKGYTPEGIYKHSICLIPQLVGLLHRNLSFLTTLQTALWRGELLAVLQVILHEWQKSCTGKCEGFPSFFVEERSFRNQYSYWYDQYCHSGQRYHQNCHWCFSSTTFIQGYGEWVLCWFLFVHCPDFVWFFNEQGVTNP